jgi:3-methyladenine DNA glycosylase/8-oxoguanine DNA glycosylase
VSHTRWPRTPTPTEAADKAGPAPDATRVVEVPRPYDFDASLRFVPFGLHDPSCRLGPGVLWRAARTPEGPATIRLAAAPDRVDAAAWGPGAGWVVHRAEALLGLQDDPAAFAPAPGPIATLARRGRGLHLVRSPWVFDALCQFVLQQRVSFRDAARAHRHLVRRLGEGAPGPPGLLLPLAPHHWLRASSEDYRRGGVDGERAGRLRSAAREAKAIDDTFDRGHRSARVVLGSVPGCGPWTVGMAMGFALADADAVPVGDLHLPSQVARALVGEPRADDARMLALLEPHRGHRFRLIRLLLETGRIRLGRGVRQ